MIKKGIKYLGVALIVILLLVRHKTIAVGGDGATYSIKFNNELVCAYSNGEDITDEIMNSEDKAKTAILEHYRNKEVAFLDFCHLGDSLNMTVDIMVESGTYYTVSWIDGKIKSIHELDKQYAEFWYQDLIINK